MVQRIWILVALAGLLFSMNGCVSGQVRLSSSDSGKTIDIKTGGSIVVELNGNPTTGYTWEAKDLDTRMLKQEGETEFKSSNPGLIGAGGTLTLTFKTLMAGKTTLELVYHRPWEKNVEPQSTYSVSVNIK